MEAIGTLVAAVLMEGTIVHLFKIEVPRNGTSERMNHPGQIPEGNIKWAMPRADDVSVLLSIHYSPTDGFTPALQITRPGRPCATVPFFGGGIPKDKLPDDGGISVDDCLSRSRDEIIAAACSSYAGILALCSTVSIQEEQIVLTVNGAEYCGKLNGSFAALAA